MSSFKRAAGLLLGAASLLAAVPASAAINLPVPANAYITFNGLDWAWANPLPGTASDLSFQGSLGWRLPTVAELASAPQATDFLFAGGNVPFGGSDLASGAHFQATNSNYNFAQSAGACATPYFASFYTHCDWQDGNGQTYGPWAGTAGAASFADQLYVRTASVNDGVPEPATWATMILGLGMVGFAMRRRQQVKVAFSF
ncbi:MAG: PEP-CTERM sorting domain-containing protein [Sphingomonadales bacterium]|nr:PEP-CTERM sorting domain-containing protein [Sphingomonadales bacterium]